MHSPPGDTEVSAPRSKAHLLRILGVGFGVAVIVGNTIGSGILLTPGTVAAQLRNPWLLFAMWTLGGVFAFLCTQSVSELGTTLPEAGGWFVYARRALGEYGGFLVGCCDFFVQSVGVAYLSIAFAEFAAGLQPVLHGHETGVAVTCVLVLALLNWVGLRAGSRAQEITSLMKALALLALVVACFVVSPKSAVAAPPLDMHIPATGLLFALVLGLQPILITYDGWYAAIYFTEEDTNPGANLPRSSLMGVLACGAIYLLVNAGMVHVLSFGGLAASHMPVADAAGMLFGSNGSRIILMVSLLAAVSTINATLLLTPRILFGMARHGLLPPWVTSVNRGGTPSGALLLCTAVALGLILTGTFESLIGIASLGFGVVYVSGFISLFVLRRREPDLARPFRMWGYPWTNLAITVGTLAFFVASVAADLRHGTYMLLFLALTYPAYLVTRKLRLAHELRLAPVPMAEAEAAPLSAKE